MNLVEAVQFGPKFKIRRAGYKWIKIDLIGDTFDWGDGLTFYPTPQDLIAKDWEVSEMNLTK